MACRLFSAKPLPESILVYFQLDFSEIRIKILLFSLKKKNVVCQIGGHFVQGEMS